MAVVVVLLPYLQGEVELAVLAPVEDGAARASEDLELVETEGDDLSSRVSKLMFKGSEMSLRAVLLTVLSGEMLVATEP